MTTTYDLIEQAASTDNLDAVAALAHWAESEEQPTTFALFLDIIGYSYDAYGEPLSNPATIERLGYREREFLTKAMIQYLRDPDRVTVWIEAFMTTEEE